MEFIFDFDSYINRGLYTPQLNETVGTIQVGHPEIYNFVNEVTNDLLFQHYNKHLLSDEYLEIRQMYFNVKTSFAKDNNIYIIKYEPSIPWISNIDIIIIEPKEKTNDNNIVSIDTIISLGLDEATEPDFKAAAFTRNKDITKLNKDCFSHCALMINNPAQLSKQDIIGAVFHELNHYYMMFKMYYNTSKSLIDDNFFKIHYPEYKYYKETVEIMKKQDINNNRLIINLSGLYIDSNYERLKKHFDNITDATIFAAEVKRVLIYCGYLLNDIEINAHKENMFTDLVYYYKNHNEQLPHSISDTTFLNENKYILIYKRAYEILKHIHNLVTDDIRIAFQIKHGTVFNDLLGYHPVKQEDIERNDKESNDDLDVFIQQAELRKAGKRVKGHKKVLSIDKCFRYLTNKCHSMFVDDIRRMVGYLPYVDLSIY